MSGADLSHFYMLQSRPALARSLARTQMSRRRWPELGKRAHPISSTTRQYQRPVGKRRWDWMASSGVEGGVEWRQNDGWNLISTILKMSHHGADYRTVGTDKGNKCPKSQRNWIEIIESHQWWKAMTVSKHDVSVSSLGWKEESGE